LPRISLAVVGSRLVPRRSHLRHPAAGRTVGPSDRRTDGAEAKDEEADCLVEDGGRLDLDEHVRHEQVGDADE
jgi:hypothetical protein